MLSFFPPPYEDEVLYSVFGRYHIRSGNVSIKSTLNDLFGTTKVTAIMDLPSNLGGLIKNMPVCSQYTEKQLIYNHTLFPFYSAFIPPDRAAKIVESMIGDNGGDIFSRIGIMASSITMNQYFKFCPVCIEEDKRKYGEMYWHRLHQIPGIQICQEHQSELYNSQVPVRGYNKHEYVLPSSDNCKVNTEEKGYSSSDLEKLIYLSEDAKVLLNNEFTKREEEWFCQQYITRLKERGYATVNNKIKQKSFAQDFVDYYGDNLLTILQSSVNKKSDTNWLTDILRRKNKTSHPVRHLLLMRFLNISINDMFNSKFEYNPFGYAPWPCLNRASEHYRESVIKDLEVSYGNDSKSPIGTFSCSCGFIYIRKGPDLSEDARYKISKIKEYGNVWEVKLKELVNLNLGLRETARRMGVDPNTVKKYAAKLGLKSQWDNNIDTKIIDFNVDSIKNDTEECIDNFRKSWLNLIMEYPQKSKTELRQLNQVLYIWLYRYDKEWLNENSPVRKSITNVNFRVDWFARDSETLTKVKKVVEEILNSSNKPERVSIGLVGSKLGIRALLEKHLDKLPDTKDYLYSVTEGKRDFQIRRIKWAIKELQNEGQELMIWRIFRKAGIRAEYKDELEEDVLKIINNENQNKHSYS